jgi:hypothetical protein
MPSPVTYRAHPGKVMPLKINKKLHLIKEDEDLTVDHDEIDYITKTHIKRAIEEKDIFEVTPDKATAKKNKEK